MDATLNAPDDPLPHVRGVSFSAADPDKTQPVEIPPTLPSFDPFLEPIPASDPGWEIDLTDEALDDL